MLEIREPVVNAPLFIRRNTIRNQEVGKIPSLSNSRTKASSSSKKGISNERELLLISAIALSMIFCVSNSMLIVINQRAARAAAVRSRLQ